MAKKIKESIPDMVKDFLPEAMDMAMKSYQRFLQDQMGGRGEQDVFGKNHTAGKAAVAHIQMLLKLSQQVDVKETESGISVSEIEETYRKAQAECKAYANTCEGEEEEMA